ncbi:Uncharacterised protein [Mycobacteroides abscessus subsp. abscessus]|nr:Uncharacterised protein [Mycobacteroides abscessus subsp. abscessus]
MLQHLFAFRLGLDHDDTHIVRLACLELFWDDKINGRINCFFVPFPARSLCQQGNAILKLPFNGFHHPVGI